MHIFILSLSQKRPIFIKGIEGSLLILIPLAIIAHFTIFALYILAIAIGISFYYTKSWIIIGVSINNIKMALDKAILASRSTGNWINNTCEIDDNLQVTTTHLGLNITFIRFKIKTNLQKTVLTKIIFSKFIQNYNFKITGKEVTT